jgi:acetyl esterase/lipase
LTHVRPGLPPFLIVSAEKDLPTLGAMADEFQAALRNQGCDARLLRVEKRNHNSIVFLAIQRTDPVGAAMLEFIRNAPR